MSIQTILLSSLAKIFPSQAPQNPKIKALSMLLNEKQSFQIACLSSIDQSINIKIDSALKDDISIFHVGLIPSAFAKYEDTDDFILNNGEPGLYPDVLYPFNESLEIKKDEWLGLWFEIRPNEKYKSGKYPINIYINDELKETLEVNLINASLPEQSLIATNWFHTDCLMTWYKFEAFSDEYWRVVENFAKAASEHGINFLLTPLFTPPLDTAVGSERPTVQLIDVTKNGDDYEFGFDKLERWVDMCDRVSIRYFEMSHLFTQWGATFAPKVMASVDGEYKQIFGWETDANSDEYIEFLTKFAKALIEFIDEKGIRERCIFHCSDEPSLEHFDSFSKAMNLIKKLFGEFKIIDALSDFDFYSKGLIETPIPANSHIEPFIGNVPELWTYYCCGQHKNYVSNRFFCMPGQRTRILGMQMYKFDVKGFLQWGYNFWYSQYSAREVNPFEESCAGKAFPSGDAYVVYPNDDGQPLISQRLKATYDAFQDMMALQLLESKIGKDAVIKILEDDTGEPISFTKYPRDEKWILNKREQINNEIAKHFN